MGTNLSFKNFTNDSSTHAGGGGGAGNGSRQPNLPLDRQSSVYSLTFDEFQNTMGGIGKDFGSMNMDELLKNIWSAEEMQNMVASSSGAQEGLQRQGSLTLPRTLSQKTVDEVWKGISKEYGNGSCTGGAVVPQRQPTLGEMTLEEFLVRAGVVREDSEINGKVNGNGGFFGDLSRSGNNADLGVGYKQNKGLGLSNNNNNTNQMSFQSSNLALNVNRLGSNQAQVQQHQNQQSRHQHQHQHQQIFPKQPNLGFTTQLPLQTSPGIRGVIMSTGDQGISGGPMQGGGKEMVGLGVATGSPGNNQLSSDGIRKSNGDTSSVSPVPYVFNEGVRGRRGGGAVEKVVERRQRRMIKNRESAARSRARKQAYTMELEAEVAKLKEENQELRKKQEEMMEMQKNQAEMMNQNQVKRHCLRRTQSGPW